MYIRIPIHELAKSRSALSAAGEFEIKTGFNKACKQKLLKL